MEDPITELLGKMKPQWIKEEVIRRAFPHENVDVTDTNGFIWIRDEKGNAELTECDVCKYSLRATSRDLEWPCPSREKCIKRIKSEVLTRMRRETGRTGEYKGV
jgi:hypothetical protein